MEALLEPRHPEGDALDTAREQRRENRDKRREVLGSQPATPSHVRSFLPFFPSAYVFLIATCKIKHVHELSRQVSFVRVIGNAVTKINYSINLTRRKRKWVMSCRSQVSNTFFCLFVMWHNILRGNAYTASSALNMDDNNNSYTDSKENV